MQTCLSGFVGSDTRVDAVVGIKMPGREEGRERANRYEARSRAIHLLGVIDVPEQ